MMEARASNPTLSQSAASARITSKQCTRVSRQQSPSMACRTVCTVDGFQQVVNSATDTDYQLQVVALNEQLAGLPALITFTTADRSLPTAAALDIQRVTGGLATITWSAPVDMGGGKIVMYDFKCIDSANRLIAHYTLDGAAVQTTVSGLSMLASYTISISASNDRTRFGASAMLQLRTGDQSAPSPPRQVQVSDITGGSIRVSCVEPEDSGGSSVSSYQLWVNGEQVDTVATCHFAVFKLRPLFVYSLQIGAVAGSFAGALSTALLISTSAPSAPSVPLNVSAIPTGGGLQVKWLPPHDLGGAAKISNYRVGWWSGTRSWTATIDAEQTVIGRLTPTTPYSKRKKAWRAVLTFVPTQL